MYNWHHIKDDVVSDHGWDILTIVNKRKIIALMAHMADFQWT